MPLTTIGLANPPQGLGMLQQTQADGRPIPFPSHRDTMSMDTVRPKDVPRGKLPIEKDDAQALRICDIEKACPSFMTQELYRHGRPEKEVVPGSKAKTYYPEADKFFDRSLTTFDIEGAAPKSRVFKTKRVVNPLTPRYDWPCAVQAEAPSCDVRWHEGRPWNSMEFKGVQSSITMERDYARDPNEHRDIELSKPSMAAKTQRFTPRDNMRIVERAGERILSTKCCTPRARCPLDPAYNVDVITKHPFHESEGNSKYAPSLAGPISGAAPRIRHRDNGEPQASLIRSDLPGALPQRFKGHLPFNLYDPPEVTPYSRHLGLETKDIEGAQTGTRKAGTL